MIYVTIEREVKTIKQNNIIVNEFNQGLKFYISFFNLGKIRIPNKLGYKLAGVDFL